MREEVAKQVIIGLKDARAVDYVASRQSNVMLNKLIKVIEQLDLDKSIKEVSSIQSLGRSANAAFSPCHRCLGKQVDHISSSECCLVSWSLTWGLDLSIEQKLKTF